MNDDQDPNIALTPFGERRAAGHSKPAAVATGFCFLIVLTTVKTAMGDGG